MPFTLLAGCVLLAVVAATSVLSERGSQAAAEGPRVDEPASPEPTDCYGALGYFSGDHQQARYVIWRESRNDPTAQHPRSTAAGCYQLLAMHAWRFDAVGCSWSQRYDPVCNTLAADHLYREEGWEPWST